MKFLLRKYSRLKRKIFASWESVDVASPDLIQIVTDAMAMDAEIQVEYQGSGWRLIQPYGWNSSQAGNVLLMCYKDTGEIRSYRLDRISQILVEDSLLADQSKTIQDDGFFQINDYSNNRANPEDFEIPLLPNMDEIMEQSENESGKKLPFDEALDILTNGLPPEVPEYSMDGEEELPEETTEETTEEIPDGTPDEIPEEEELPPDVQDETQDDVQDETQDETQDDKEKENGK